MSRRAPLPRARSGHGAYEAATDLSADFQNEKRMYVCLLTCDIHVNFHATNSKETTAAAKAAGEGAEDEDSPAKTPRRTELDGQEGDNDAAAAVLEAFRS